MDSMTPTEIAYFWLFVKKTDSCWEWQGSLTKSGYGRYCLNGKMVRAHRISYYLFNSCINKKKIICHKCDNKKCVNPDHLWEGTSKENTHDMISKGRLIRFRSKHKGAISKYPGVTYRKETGKWRARTMFNYKNYLIGEFNTEIEAFNAYKKFKKSNLQSFLKDRPDTL